MSNTFRHQKRRRTGEGRGEKKEDVVGDIDDNGRDKRKRTTAPKNVQQPESNRRRRTQQQQKQTAQKQPAQKQTAQKQTAQKQTAQKQFAKKPTESSSNYDTLQSLNLPDSLVRALQSSWVEPPAVDHAATKEQLVTEATAPLHVSGMDKVVPVRQRRFFFYKFPNELSFPDLPFRAAHADRKWHEIKEELEDKYGIKKKRQKKQNIGHGAFIAYRLEDWKKIKRRQHIFERPEHLPLPAHEVIHPDEKLVIACFPENHVAHIYKEVKVLRFKEEDQELDEEARLDKILGFSAAPAVPEKWELKGRPPIGYRCHNCSSTEHYRHHCDKARRMEPKGIPKMFLERDDNIDEQQAAYMLGDGTTVKVKQMDTEFERRFATRKEQNSRE